MNSKQINELNMLLIVCYTATLLHYDNWSIHWSVSPLITECYSGIFETFKDLCLYLCLDVDGIRELTDNNVLFYTLSVYRDTKSCCFMPLL